MNNEIEEEGEEDGRRGGLETVREIQFEGSNSGTVSMNGEDNVYVGVGKGDSSMEALRWALDNLITSSSSTLLYLIHVFPETRSIPYPLGRLTREQASQEQLETFMSQEREKRRTLLNKFIHACSASKVKVETILVESDSVAKALQDLITILHIKKLVLGIDKSSARKANSTRGNSVPEQIMRSTAAELCEVKVICQGKEIKMEETVMERVPSKSPKVQERTPSKSPKQQRLKKDQSNDPFACICFFIIRAFLSIQNQTCSAVFWPNGDSATFKGPLSSSTGFGISGGVAHLIKAQFTPSKNGCCLTSVAPLLNPSRCWGSFMSRPLMSATTKAAATTLIAHVTACVSPALATPHEIKVATKLGASTRIPRRRRRRRKEGDTLGVD
uniref:UspA domain-containing protein n=1 Tax=Brassica campestris TaxID=3711 RepID=M4E057_BRACM